jgi:hypothetical protein
MKTQVIHLESYDDRHSVLDRLNWGQADRIILIWPLRGNPLQDKLDLKLIHRRCSSSQIKLALVCRNREIAEEAHALGIPVFRSLRQAQRTAWEYSLPMPSDPERPPSSHTREELSSLIHESAPPAWMQQRSVRIGSVVASLLAILVMVVFLVPGARIEYTPTFEIQNLEIILLADPEINAFNLAGSIPARGLSISVEGRAETEPSGQTGIPDKSAAGIIELTNLTDQELLIPTGTLIRTADPNSSIRFATSTASTLPGESGATTLIPIEALNPGSNSNLPASTLVIVEGDLAIQVTATNPEPTSGGSEKQSASPTSEDYESLRSELLASLWDSAQQEAILSLGGQDVILDTSPRKVTIVEEVFTPAKPEPARSLTLTLQVEYEILYLAWEDLTAMGNAALDAILPAGLSARPETLELQPTGMPVFLEDGRAEWEVIFTRLTFQSSQIQPAISDVLGRSPDKARDILQTELDLAAPPEITMFPEWWPLMPLMEFRIQVIDLLTE